MIYLVIVVWFLVEMEASAGVGCYCKSSKPAVRDEQQIKYGVEKKILKKSK
jgi:hypothetical protein